MGAKAVPDVVDIEADVAVEVVDEENQLNEDYYTV